MRNDVLLTENLGAYSALKGMLGDTLAIKTLNLF
jgi:hypothetical protein